ncbi:hyalin-like [Amphiura filiformis]|uniref:hyalin-like n=1 Tax=Amphiura filiformis TaxID=82378 RepID=UPI003B22397D
MMDIYLLLVAVAVLASPAAAQDTTPPTISNCPSSPVQADAAVGSTASVSFTAPTCTDASGVQSFTSNPNLGTQTTLQFPIGAVLLIEYTCTDNAGNMAYCAFTMHADAQGGPTVSNCPGAIYGTYTASQSAVAQTWTEPTGVNQQSRSHAPGSNFNRGCTTVTYNFATGSLISLCTFPVCLYAVGSGFPSTGPAGLTLQCPNVVSRINPGQSSTQVSYAVTATGGTPPYNYNYNPISGSTFNTGTPQTVSVTALDNNGNQATCQFTVLFVTVGITCPTVTSGASSQISFNSPTLSNFANSNAVALTYTYVDQNQQSSTQTIQASQPTHTLSNFAIGVNTISVSATDGTNTATCSFSYNRLTTGTGISCPTVPSSSSSQITFNRPSLSNFPTTNNVFCTYTYTVQSQPQTLTLSYNQQTHILQNMATGSNTISVTCTDVTNTVNTANCQFIYVRTSADTTPPTITSCPQNQVANVAQAGQSATVTYPSATATDNSGGAVQLSYSTHQVLHLTLAQLQSP